MRLPGDIRRGRHQPDERVKATEGPIQGVAHPNVRRHLAVMPAVEVVAAKDVDLLLAAVTATAAMEWQAEEAVQGHPPGVRLQAVVLRSTWEVQQGHTRVRVEGRCEGTPHIIEGEQSVPVWCKGLPIVFIGIVCRVGGVSIAFASGAAHSAATWGGSICLMQPRGRWRGSSGGGPRSWAALCHAREHSNEHGRSPSCECLFVVRQHRGVPIDTKVQVAVIVSNRQVHVNRRGEFEVGPKVVKQGIALA